MVALMLSLLALSTLLIKKTFLSYRILNGLQQKRMNYISDWWTLSTYTAGNSLSVSGTTIFKTSSFE